MQIGAGYKAILEKIGLSFIYKATGAGLALALQIYIAKLMDDNSFGIYVLLMAWCNIIALVVGMGRPFSSIKYIPKYLSKKKPEFAQAFIHDSSQKIIALGLVIFLLFGAVVILSSALDKPIEIYQQPAWPLLFVFAALIIIQAFISLHSNIYQACKKLSLALLPYNIIRPMMIIACIQCLVLLKLELSITHVLLCNAAVGAAFLLILYLKPPFKCQGEASSNAKQRSIWLYSGLSFMLQGMVNFTLSQADILMLGSLSQAADAGYYAAASKIANIAIFIMASSYTVIAPMISKGFYEKDKKLDQLIFRSTLINTLAALCITLAFVIFAEPVLGLYGEAFKSAKTALIILLLSQLINAFTGPAALLLNLANYHTLTLKIMLIAALSNCLLNYLLIPQYGLVGAAIATASVFICWNVSMVFFVKQKLGINSSLFRLPITIRK